MDESEATLTGDSDVEAMETDVEAIEMDVESAIQPKPNTSTQHGRVESKFVTLFFWVWCGMIYRGFIVVYHKLTTRGQLSWPSKINAS